MLNICSSKHMTIIMIFSLDPGIYLGSQFPSMSVTPCGVEFIRVSGEDSSYKSLSLYFVLCGLRTLRPCGSCNVDWIAC